MHTPEQQAYITKHKLKVVQQAGDDTLYQSRWGCRTIGDIMAMHQWQVDYFNEIVSAKPELTERILEVCDALELRNERCVDEYGCGLF